MTILASKRALNEYLKLTHHKIFWQEIKPNKVYAITHSKVVKLVSTENEVTITKRMGDCGIAPVVYDHIQFEQQQQQIGGKKNLVHAIVMERMEYTLQQFMKNVGTMVVDIRDRIKNEIVILVEDAIRLGVIHNDLHFKNIMVSYNNGEDGLINPVHPYLVRIIDWGLVTCAGDITFRTKELELYDTIRRLHWSNLK